MSHPTDITCPACNAAPGEWCTVNGLRRAKGPHPSRVKAYRAATGTAPNWPHKCEVCGAAPVVPATGLCGPCTFVEAGTIGGNW
jgi:hypothetical protein